MLTKDAIVQYYRHPKGQLEWHIPIEWHEVGRYRFHGEATQYYPTGEIKVRRTYHHGVEIGEEIMYYKDGGVMSVLPFKNGKKDGTHTFIHPGGKTEQVKYAEGEIEKPKEKGSDAADSGRQPESKKILPRDYIPPALRR